MQLVITNYYDTQSTRLFEGAEDEVRRALIAAYPWVLRRLTAHAALPDVLEVLNRSQSLTARVVPDGEPDLHLAELAKAEAHLAAAAQLGHDAELERALAAARFLAAPDAVPPSPEALQAALAAHDEDPWAAALAAWGVASAPAMVEQAQTIAGLAALPVALAKAEVEIKDVEALTPNGEPFAAMVRRAAARHGVEPLTLNGKHSGGALVARDPETQGSLLLKPGVGANPQAGTQDDPASEAKREAAFFALAAGLGLQDVVPEAHLLTLDGREYAAIRLLGRDWADMNQIRRTDPARPRRLFHLFLGDGTLHRWAALLFIGGETDGNAGNVMARGDEVKLIDHGSAWAGANFAPALDPKTFVPYVLRAFAPGDFAALPPLGRYQALPRLHPDAGARLGAWLQGLDGAAVAAAAAPYGIDPAPAAARLRRLQALAAEMPADLAVNAVWTLP